VAVPQRRRRKDPDTGDVPGARGALGRIDGRAEREGDPGQPQQVGGRACEQRRHLLLAEPPAVSPARRWWGTAAPA
jgi:hypothetical protein